MYRIEDVQLAIKSAELAQVDADILDLRAMFNRMERLRMTSIGSLSITPREEDLMLQYKSQNEGDQCQGGDLPVVN